MYLNCLLTSIVFSMTFCGKYYLLETEEKKHHLSETNGTTSTTPSSNVSIRPRSNALLRSPGKGKIIKQIKGNKFSPKVKLTVVTTKLLHARSVLGISMLV